MTAYPLRVCSNSEMRELDRTSDQEFGLNPDLLMENAGRAAAQIILEKFPSAGRETEILVFAGKGNNAGDAFVVARRFLCLERKVRLFHFQPETGYQGAARKNFDILRRMKIRATHVESVETLREFFDNTSGPFTIIDGLLGTGLHAPLSGLFYETVECVNQLENTQIISLDLPSGVSGDTGEVCGNSMMAHLTISFGFPKLGHFLPPGAARRGELVNVDISFPARFRKEGQKFLLMKHPMATLLKERDRYGHKNSFGHTLVIGGSLGRMGAVAMAARAAHKMGTGLVTAASWPDGFDALIQKIPTETMGFPLHLEGPEHDFEKNHLQNYSSVVVGPGLGLRIEGKKLMEELLENYRGPLVVDADALNLIADHKLFSHVVNRRAPTVLTPHPGEMARLLGISKEEVMKDPLQAVQEAVKLTHSIVLLKGAATIISSPEELIFLNHYPNDGMATAGSGDVLAGMIGGLLGQKMDPFSATLLGVYLHSLAGDFAAKQFGHRSMTAPDMIENIGNAFQDLKSAEFSYPPEGRIALL